MYRVTLGQLRELRAPHIPAILIANSLIQLGARREPVELSWTCHYLICFLAYRDLILDPRIRQLGNGASRSSSRPRPGHPINAMLVCQWQGEERSVLTKNKSGHVMAAGACQLVAGLQICLVRL